MSRATLYCGDVRQVLSSLPAESVQCVVTSPPYWGLRDYGTGRWSGGDDGCKHRVGGQVQDTKWAGAITTGQRPGVDASLCIDCGATKTDAQLGLERTPEEYVANMVAVFREVRRVLRSDGCVWLNLGDSYAGSPVGTFNGGGFKDKSAQTGGRDLSGVETSGKMDKLKASGLKPKDLVGIPWRVAFALQADGWWLRSDVIWAKPNPMPESVTDRPTRSHEYLFLLTKSATYWYDAQAIAEPVAKEWGAENGTIGRNRLSAEHGGQRDPTVGLCTGTRNARSVWTIATTPYPQAHFATFPEELARRCILAGSSPRACEHCGAPWERVTERPEPPERIDYNGKHATTDKQAAGRRILAAVRAAREAGGDHDNPFPAAVTTGWRPTCSCENAGTGRCVVLDPFSGSGTTCAVAVGNGRDAIGIDLNPSYNQLANQRIGPMFVDGIA